MCHIGSGHKGESEVTSFRVKSLVHKTATHSLHVHG